MPDLDVSDILLSPEFCEELAIIRTAQTINDSGRAVLTPALVVPAPFGVVNPEQPDPLVIGQEAEINKSIIMVHAYGFRFLGPTETTQPDKVQWQGITYIVTRSFDWSKYGTGFTAAKCEAQSLLASATP